MNSLDISKISKRQFLKKELTENPEFFKAFPHLQAFLNIGPDGLVQTGEEEYEAEYVHNAQVNFKDYSKEVPFFDSLL